MPPLHDRLFKLTFNRPDGAAELIRLALAPEEHAPLDLATIRLAPTESIDRRLGARLADVIVTGRLRNAPPEAPLLPFVIEHWCRPPPDAPWQQVRLAMRWIDRNRGPRAPIPPWICIALTHGGGGDDLAQALAYDLPAGLRVSAPIRRIDLTRWSVDALRTAVRRPWVLLTLLCLKLGRRGGALIEALARCAAEITAVARSPEREMLTSWYLYVVGVAGDATAERLVALYDKVLVKEEKMFEFAYEHARRWGQKKGARMIVVGLLEDRFGPLPEWVDEQLEDADFDTLQRYSRRLHAVASLDELFPGRQ